MSTGEKVGLSAMLALGVGFLGYVFDVFFLTPSGAVDHTSQGVPIYAKPDFPYFWALAIAFVASYVALSMREGSRDKEND